MISFSVYERTSFAGIDTDTAVGSDTASAGFLRISFLATPRFRQELAESKSLNKANLKYLLDESGSTSTKAYGFTSDEVRSIHRDSGLSYQYLFSGVMKAKDKEIFKADSEEQK